MSEPDDPPPSYEDIMTGGIGIDPPKYSNAADQSEEDIRSCPRVTRNQTAARAPQSVPVRAPRGKWYGKHHLVPSSTPARTMCQREASLDAPPSIRMWMQQERSLEQHSDDFWPDKKFSNCCLIAILVGVVLFILMLGRVITMIEDRKPLDTVERHWERPVLELESTTKFDLLTNFKNCSQFSNYNDGENYTEACFTPPPSIEYGSYIPAVQPKQCYDEDMKLVEYFSDGTKVRLSCNPNKVLSSNLVFLDPGYTGRLKTNVQLECTGGSWKYPAWRYQPNKKTKYKQWIQVIDAPVGCITETELIKQNIG